MPGNITENIHHPTAEQAISFALKHLSHHELFDYLTDWSASADLTPWVNALEYDRRSVAGEPEDDIIHLLRG